MSTRLTLCLKAGVFFMTASLSSAVTLYDNLSQPALGNDQVTATQWNANKFVTDATIYSLPQVTLRLSSTDTSSALQVLLYSDSANNPGSQVATIGSTSSIPSTATDITFTPSGIVLSANTTYWIVVNTSGAGAYRWYFPSTLSGTGVAFNSAFSRSNNGGSSWALGASTDPPYYLQLTGDVPEPSSAILASLALALVAAARRRSSRT